MVGYSAVRCISRYTPVSPMPHPLNIAARGVYYLPWTGTNGELYLTAVDRRGRRILEATVYPGADPDAAELALWDLLDREDPEPRLRLVS